MSAPKPGPDRAAIEKRSRELENENRRLRAALAASRRRTARRDEKLRELRDQLDALNAVIGAAANPTRWWRALDDDGTMLAETSSPRDFDHLGFRGKPGVRIQRLFEANLGEWREVES